MSTCAAQDPGTWREGLPPACGSLSSPFSDAKSGLDLMGRPWYFVGFLLSVVGAAGRRCSLRPGSRVGGRDMGPLCAVRPRGQSLLTFQAR